MKFFNLIIAVVLSLGSTYSTAQIADEVDDSLKAFRSFYEQQFGRSQRCIKQNIQEQKVCSAILRNEGNAPFILFQNTVSDEIVVLVHGLSDSPFYLRSIAEALHDQGSTVAVMLMPGHGLIEADADMEDTTLSDRWTKALANVVQIVRPMGQKLYVGGFSAGGALAAQFALRNENDVSGLLLFSSALGLSENAESMSRIWGMQAIARWVDGDYVTHGPNPFKYPAVSMSSVIELMEVIWDVRSQYEDKPVNIPTFVAHSVADVTTPLSGVEAFLANNLGAHTQVIVDQDYQLCHGDLTLNQAQVDEINFPSVKDQIVDRCHVPKANPLYQHMIAMLVNFIDQTKKAPTE